MTLLNKRRRDKTAAEFADALMSYLGRKSDRSILRYESFQQSEGFGRVKMMLYYCSIVILT